jgi:hypothetical protein
MVAMVFAASPVDVRSTTNCPSTEAVVERLLPLLPAAPGPVEGQDVAEVQVDEVQANGAMELHLRLARADGSEIGDRRLLMHGTCQDVAEVVATVIAAWKTQPLPGDAPDVAPVPAFKEGDVLSQVRSSQRRPPQIRPLQIVVGAGVGAAFVGGIASDRWARCCAWSNGIPLAIALGLHGRNSSSARFESWPCGLAAHQRFGLCALARA